MICTAFFSRREFLKGLSLAVLAPMLAREIFASETKGARLPLAFSTLGCPLGGWNKILEFAGQHGFAAIELPGLEGNLDLLSHPIFAVEHIEQTKREIRASKLRIACVSSSANLHVADPEKRAREMGDARRFIDLAATLGAPYVRVFGGRAEADKSPMPSEEKKNGWPQACANSENAQARAKLS
jgi:sugar phosphate isomerase/epimerase